MRKLGVLSVIVLIAVSDQAFGQASVSLGLKAGLNFNTISANILATSFSGRIGYHGGAFVNIKMSGLAIVPEVIYSMQGADISSPTSTGPVELGYLNVPVLLKLYLLEGLNVQLGPQFGFLTSASSAGLDIRDFVKGTDTSIAVGIGFDISKFVIDGRYNLGISEINENVTLNAAKNRVFQLSVGYKLVEFGR